MKLSQEDLIHFHRTDVGNAELFAALFGDTLRYDHNRKRWLVWQEHWWTQDTDGYVQRQAKELARCRLRAASSLQDADVRSNEAKFAISSESRSRQEAIVKLAESEAPIADPGTEWDTDPWLFGVANGVVDLRTGSLRTGRQSDRITLHSDIAFESTAECPRWTQFLKEIFGGDEELIGYIQRAVGYCLTGETREQVLFLCYGTGANGKSTFLEVLRDVLGGYSNNLPFSSFEEKSKSAIPNDIAGLVGRRFVTALETNEYAQLNEARIKALTGCDPITARFLHREFFTFCPLAKYWLAFNHKPQVVDDSDGFWRRIRLIPFKQQFSSEKADPDILEKLKNEAPGILAWAVRGCLEWQRQRLNTPTIVSECSGTYREESDPLAEFLTEKCTVDASESVPNAILWAAYLNWSNTNRELRPLTRREFSQRLRTRGFDKKASGHKKVLTWYGIGLKPSFSGSVAEVRADADAKSHLLVN